MYTHILCKYDLKLRKLIDQSNNLSLKQLLNKCFTYILAKTCFITVSQSRKNRNPEENILFLYRKHRIEFSGCSAEKSGGGGGWKGRT